MDSVLNRNAEGAAAIFAKVKRGTWGLRAWYPGYREKLKSEGEEGEEKEGKDLV